MAIIDRRGLMVDGSSPSSADTPDVALAIKLAVRVASTANLSLAGLQTVDGVPLIGGNRVLVRNQADATQNGIYVVSSGNWARSVDFDASAEIASGVIVTVSAGSVGAQTMYQLTTADPILLGMSNLMWTLVSGTAGPQGIQGLQGETGDQGPQGVAGAPGISGTSAATRIRVVDTAGLDPITAYENGDTVNGVVLATNDLVLRAKAGADSANGVYVVPASGPASRHPDFATYDSLPGTLFSVMEGAIKADTIWQCTSNRGGVIGVTSVGIEEFTSGGAYGVGTYAGRGIDCVNNSSTPNTQFDLDVDELILRNSSGATVFRTNPGAAITCNISTAGPVINGRDQAGALSNNSWAHFYWIWDGTTLATIVSASAPPTGPILPNGYTYWAYAGPVRVDGSGNLLRVRIKNNRAHYGTQDVTRPVIMTGGAATVETALDVSAIIPTNASDFHVGLATWGLSSDGSGALNGSVLFRVSSGVNYLGVVVNLSGLANSATMRFDTGGSLLIPNVGQNFYYLWTVISGSLPALTMTAFSYGIPNGG